MTKYKVDSIYEIRKYLWKELTDSGVFDANDYYSDNLGQEIIPIIPVQQQPEMNQFLSGKKHIVYDKIGLTYEDIWLLSCEKIIFTIYAIDVADINEVRNLMLDVFRRMDDSAKDVNEFKSENNLIFHNTMILEASATAPSEEIQGFFSADVIIEVKYSRVTGPDGRFI